MSEPKAPPKTAREHAEHASELLGVKRPHEHVLAAVATAHALTAIALAMTEEDLPGELAEECLPRIRPSSMFWQFPPHDQDAEPSGQG
jgi:hypothetical protein